MRLSPCWYVKSARTFTSPMIMQCSVNDLVKPCPLMPAVPNALILPCGDCELVPVSVELVCGTG